MKDSLTTAFGSLKEGDKVFSLEKAGYFEETGKYFHYVVSTVLKIEKTKSGKRIKVTFEDEKGRVSKSSAVSPNTIMNQTPQNWYDEQLKMFPLRNKKPTV